MNFRVRYMKIREKIIKIKSVQFKVKMAYKNFRNYINVLIIIKFLIIILQHFNQLKSNTTLYLTADFKYIIFTNLML